MSSASPKGDSMTSAVLTQRVAGQSKLAALILVVAAAAVTAAAAQWRIPLPFTPVPITGQTFAVLLAGAALGPALGAASQLLYVAMGGVGMPVFAGGTGGVEVVRGATAGYLAGFIVAAWLVGNLAQRGQDRTFATMFTSFFAGTAVIYVFGVAGLMAVAGLDATEAVAQGVVPFVVGDVIKATAAGLVLPSAWRLSRNH